MGCIHLKSIIEELYFSNLGVNVSGHDDTTIENTLDRIASIESWSTPDIVHRNRDRIF